jgi:hypothetical protein
MKRAGSRTHVKGGARAVVTYLAHQRLVLNRQAPEDAVVHEALSGIDVLREELLLALAHALIVLLAHGVRHGVGLDLDKAGAQIGAQEVLGAVDLAPATS